MGHEAMLERFGSPSAIVCPHCDGPIWEIADGTIVFYRCAEGHAYSPESLLAAEGETLERALWVAVRTLDERAALLRRLVQKTPSEGQNIVTVSLRSKAEECEKSAASIRAILGKLGEAMLVESIRVEAEQRVGSGSGRTV
jgi:two-component system chemotaxis response regulator CheB